MRKNKELLVVNIIVFCSFASFSQGFQEFNREIKIDQFFNELQGQVGYQGIDVPGQGNSIGDLEAQGMQNKEADEIFNQEAALKRQQKTEVTGFNRNNKGFLDKALDTVRNADKDFDYLRSSGKVCVPGEETVTDTTIKTCDQYYSLDEQTCLPRQVIELDPKYHYQCSKKREVKEKICHEEIKSIKCQNKDNCVVKGGGIKKGSIKSDAISFYEHGVLKIGKNVNVSTQSAACNLFTYSTSFEVTNKALIDEFKLSYVRYDDYIEIMVNEHSVFSGPEKGKGLHKINNDIVKFDNVNSVYKCERATDWHDRPNIDLRPYLEEGYNTITLKVIIKGAGHGYIEVLAKQYCLPECQIIREEKCEYR